MALTRRGSTAAYELLVERYQSRLLGFCRHMLRSREDAEDVLQEVFAAAFNALMADEREINVRPWLYRIARNRSLNHLRRTAATGMDSMDIFLADHGQSVADRFLQRESFRSLLQDIGQLAESQRSALLLREIDGLSYEQVAEVMDTTVPSVKSLLVRARVALAEAAEARKLSCEQVREQLGEVAEGLSKLGAPARRHVRDCDRCRSFQKQLKRNERTLAAVAPIGGIALLHRLLAGKISSGTGAGGAVASSGASSGGASAGLATGGALGGTAGLGGLGGLAGFGTGAIATKAVAGIATAALLAAGAAVSDHQLPSTHQRHGTVAAARPIATAQDAVAEPPETGATLLAAALPAERGFKRQTKTAGAGNHHGKHAGKGTAKRTGAKLPGHHLAAAPAAAALAEGSHVTTSATTVTASEGSHPHSSAAGADGEVAKASPGSGELPASSGGATHKGAAEGPAHSSGSAGGSETVEVVSSSSELPASSAGSAGTTAPVQQGQTASCASAGTAATAEAQAAERTGGAAVPEQTCQTAGPASQG